MVRRIAIVRLSAIGDVVHALPLAASLRRLHPRAEIHWIVQPGPAPLLAHHPFVDRLHLYPRRGGTREVLRFLRRLGTHRFDLAADAQGNLKSGLVLLATRARVRVGLARGCYREPLGALAANRHAPNPDGPHSVDRTLALCRLLGDAAPRAEYGLRPTSEEREATVADLAAIGSPTVAISVGGDRDVREWTDEGYAETARALADRGAGVVILAGPAHAGRGRRIADRAGVPHRAGTTDLRGLLAHLDALARRPRSVLLACDSAPLHLAVAVGLRVLCLSGPQDPRRTGPYGPGGEVLTRYEGLPCAPCRKRTCRLRGDERACMRRIGATSVIDRLLACVSHGFRTDHEDSDRVSARRRPV